MRLVAWNANYNNRRHSFEETVALVDPLHAEEYLKLSRSTLYKLCQAGKIPGQKVGRHWRFLREVIDRWLTDSTAHSNSKDKRSDR